MLETIATVIVFPFIKIYLTYIIITKTIHHIQNIAHNCRRYYLQNNIENQNY